MSRKRLTDLLKEETKDLQTEPMVIDVVAEPSSGETTQPPADNPVDTSDRDRLQTALTTAEQRIKALEKQLSSLQKDLKAQSVRETTFVQEIDLLKENFQQEQAAHTTQTATLTAEVEALKASLEEAKRDNRLLAEANLQLTAKLNALEVVSAAPSPEPVLKHPALTPKLEAARQASSYPSRDRTVTGRPIGSNRENQRVNNANIGWFD